MSSESWISEQGGPNCSPILCPTTFRFTTCGGVSAQETSQETNRRSQPTIQPSRLEVRAFQGARRPGNLRRQCLDGALWTGAAGFAGKSWLLVILAVLFDDETTEC